MGPTCFAELHLRQKLLCASVLLQPRASDTQFLRAIESTASKCRMDLCTPNLPLMLFTFLSSSSRGSHFVSLEGNVTSCEQDNGVVFDVLQVLGKVAGTKWIIYVLDNRIVDAGEAGFTQDESCVPASHWVLRRKRRAALCSLLSN